MSAVEQLKSGHDVVLAKYVGMIQERRLEGAFGANTIPFTPQELIEEILINIQPKVTDTILIPFTVEAVPYLLYKGFTDIVVTTDKYCELTNKICKVFGVSYVLMEKLVDMKFDVVIGNPPYQDPNKKSKNSGLWIEFTHKAFEFAKEDGIVAFITPPTWVNDKKLSNKILANNVFLKKECGKYFNAGTEAWAYISKKSSNSIVNKKVSKLSDDITDAIIEKVFSSNGEKFDFSTKQRANSYDDGEKTFPAYHTKNELIMVANKSKNFNTPKIIASKSGYFNPMFEPGNAGTTENCFWAPIKTEESKNAIDFLNSKLIKIIIGNWLKYSGFNTDHVVRDLPRVDFTKTWTDIEVYEYFNLTQEEIDYVEQNS